MRPNYAFIDSQNLNLGVANDLVTKKGRMLYRGRKLDFKKFRDYLRTKYRDGDFVSLYNFVCDLYTLLNQKNLTNKKSTKSGGRSKSLGMLGHGDTSTITNSAKHVNSKNRDVIKKPKTSNRSPRGNV